METVKSIYYQLIYITKVILTLIIVILLIISYSLNITIIYMIDIIAYTDNLTKSRLSLSDINCNKHKIKGYMK